MLFFLPPSSLKRSAAALTHFKHGEALGDVGVDGLHVFVVVELVDENFCFFDLFVGELDGGGRDALQVAFGGLDAEFFDLLSEGTEGFEFAVDEDGVFDDFHFFQAGVDEFEFDFFELVVAFGKLEDGFAVEHKTECSGL